MGEVFVAEVGTEHRTRQGLSGDPTRDAHLGQIEEHLGLRVVGLHHEDGGAGSLGRIGKANQRPRDALLETLPEELGFGVTDRSRVIGDVYAQGLTDRPLGSRALEARLDLGIVNGRYPVGEATRKRQDESHEEDVPDPSKSKHLKPLCLPGILP